jgi:hypothetical protein
MGGFRLIISQTWRFLFSLFPSLPGAFHWVVSFFSPFPSFFCEHGIYAPLSAVVPARKLGANSAGAHYSFSLLLKPGRRIFLAPLKPTVNRWTFSISFFNWLSVSLHTILHWVDSASTLGELFRTQCSHLFRPNVFTNN